MSVVYLDTSAFVKAVVAEPESDRLALWLRGRPDRASCALLRVEAVRAVRPHGATAVERARAAFDRLTLIRLDDELLDAAAELVTPLRSLEELVTPLRSLDAIHLAAAQALGTDLAAVVTYDERMARAGRELGLDVVAP